MSGGHIGFPCVGQQVIERFAQVVAVRQHRHALVHLACQFGVRIFAIKTFQRRLFHLSNRRWHKQHRFVFDRAIQLFAARNQHFVARVQLIHAFADTRQIRFGLIQLLINALFQHTVGQQLIFNGMHEHRRAGSRDIKLAFERHLLVIADQRILCVMHQAEHAERAADDVHHDDHHIARHRRRVLQIADAFVPHIIIAVKLIDLRGVLPAIEQVQPAQRRQTDHNAHKLPPAKRHGDGKQFLHQQHQRGDHVDDDPPVGDLHQRLMHERPPADNHLEHRRDVDAQRQRGQQNDPFLDIGVSPDPRYHGILQRDFHQEQWEQIPPHRDDIAERIQRDKQVLQFIAQRLGEKQKPDDALGVSAFLGDENQNAGKLHHQAATHAQQVQRFAVFLHQQHKNGCDEQQPNEHKQHKRIRLRFFLLPT